MKDFVNGKSAEPNQIYDDVLQALTSVQLSISLSALYHRSTQEHY